jgi:soluble lytic murein transglycosylase
VKQLVAAALAVAGLVSGCDGPAPLPQVQVGEAVVVTSSVIPFEVPDAVGVTTIVAAARGDREALAELTRNTTPGRFEDWRLLVLAESTVGGRREALETLAADPTSPLAGGARRLVAAEDLERGDRARAWGWLEADLDRADAASLELAWQVVPDPALAALALATAARAPQLLPSVELAKLARVSDDPEVAQRVALAVAPELARRGHAGDARKLLDRVATEQRRSPWRRASAQVELSRGRALAAVATLAGPLPEDELEVLETRFVRAEALLALARSDTRRAAVHRAHAAVDLAAVAQGANDRLATKAAGRWLATASGAGDRLVAIERLAHLDPEGGAGPRALFELGWQAWERKDSATALAAWQRLLDQPGATAWRSSASYWVARALADLGHDDAAARRFTQAARGGGFYREQVRRRGVVGAAGPALEPPATPELGKLDRVAAFLEAGAPELARREFDAHEKTPGPAQAYLLARIYAAEGRPREAVTAVRPGFPALGAGLFEEVAPAVLDLYYPLEHAEVIEQWSLRRQLDPTLVAGMIRQESAFDVMAVSHAGARGLLQLMPPTAREVARRERLAKPTPGDLHDPGLSVRLGSAYLAECLEMFSGEVELALAGYNAGPYRVRRWRRERPNVSMDEFVESMPLSEPRDYVKRVLQHRDAYRLRWPSPEGA